MKSSPNKILTFVVVLLVLVNIALVIFMLTGRDKHDTKRGGARTDPFEMMVKELNMTDQQKKECQDLREAHFKNIKPMIDSVRVAKAAFFGLVKDSTTNDSLIDSYSRRVTNIQSEIDKVTFAHFVRVRKLFDASQQLKFDDFIQKMMQRNRKDSSSKK